MENNSTKKTLAWLGLGCGVLSLLSLLCPLCFLSAGLISYFEEPKVWEAADNVMMIISGAAFLIGLVIGIAVGGYSLYYLLTSGKERE